MVGRVDGGEEEEEGFDEQSVLGMGEEAPAEEEELCPQSTPVRGACDEMCTPIRRSPQVQGHGETGTPPPGSRGMHPLAPSEKESSPPPPRQNLS